MGSEASQTTPAVEPVGTGDVLAGRYRLERIVGAGGMGVVWAARQLPTERPVAVKIVTDADADNLARFLREARVSASLVHRHIVQVFDFGELAERNVAFMVMDLLTGETLASKLRSGGRIDADRARELMIPVLSALQAAHDAGVVHRDLKPDNVFLAREYDGMTTIKVLDFGLARPIALATEATSITRTGAVMGTPFYMAPEQVYGQKDVDERVDVWAAGVMLYECLTGVRPFAGENVGQVFQQISSRKYRPMRDIVSDVPEALETLVARMLEHDRDNRIGSLTEVMKHLGGPRAPMPANTAPLPTTTIPAERTPSGLTRDLRAPNPAVQAADPFVGAPRARASSSALVVLVAVLALGVGTAIGMKLQSNRDAARANAFAPPAISTASPTPPPTEAPAAAEPPVGTAITSVTSDHASPTAAASATTVAVKRPSPRTPRTTATSGASSSATDPLAGPRFSGSTP